MEFISVGSSEEIKEGGVKSFDIKSKEIAVARIDGTLYAFSRKCTHMGGDLTKGKLEGKIITCPLHGSKFDITTGKTIRGPKIAFIAFNTGNIMTYPVKVENSQILVGI